MLPDYREYYRIIRKHYNPKSPISRIMYKDYKQCVRFHFGFINDNQDPDKKSRVQVRFPQWGDNVISNWVPLARPFTGSQAGIFMLPEIDEQVVCAFINDNPSYPIVLGSVYNKKNPPPVSDCTGNNIKMFMSRSGSCIILDDTDGEEKIEIYMKDGKMRMILDANAGLSVVNELGDITIKCRKLIIEAADAAGIAITKDLKITCDQDVLKLESTKGMEIKSGKDAVCSGTKIKLKGSSGVTAENKMMATKDCNVVGVDLHDIKVPTNSGLVTIPAIPHPYAGKINDKLSEDVIINDKNAATKDSKCKYDTPGHICMPPGVQFASNPSNEGVISSGTISSVKINDKEAAVLGSMAKTCNDPTDQETCVVVAIGASIPIPVMMPGMDPDQFQKDGGTVMNNSTPIAKVGTPVVPEPRSITTVRWSASTVKAGEEVTLTANLTGQYDFANVIFTIWKEDQDRETETPVDKFSAQNQGGTAETTVRFYKPDKDAEEDEIKYIAEAKSFRCDPVESSALTVEKIVPEFENLKWYHVDEDGNEEEVSELEYGKEAILRADVTNVDDDELIRVRIYEVGYEAENQFIEQENVRVVDGAIEVHWTVACDRKRLEELTEDDTLKYVFVADEAGVTSDDSEELEITFGFTFTIVTDPENTPLDDKFVLKSTDDNETYSQELSVSDDKIEGDNAITLHYEGLKPGLDYTLEHVPAGESEIDTFFYQINFVELLED